VEGALHCGLAKPPEDSHGFGEEGCRDLALDLRVPMFESKAGNVDQNEIFEEAWARDGHDAFAEVHGLAQDCPDGP